MYNLVICISCISLLVLFVECWVVFRQWKGVLHSYLFLSCVATLINNAGYLLALTSHTQQEYVQAIKFSYLGRVWITYALFMFISELVQFKIPRFVKVILSLVNVATYIVVFTTEYTGLYYSTTSFAMNGPLPTFTHTNGIWHDCWNVLLYCYIIFGMYLLIKGFLNEKNPIARKRILVVALAIFTISLFLIIEVFDLVLIAELFDVTMIGFPISSAFMFLAIFRYKLLDTGTLARKFAIDELSEGIIAVDKEGKISYYNKPAASIFPEIKTAGAGVVELIRSAIDTDEPVRIGERLYSPEANTLIHDGYEAGTVYVVKDDTEHFRYMEELEEQKQIADNANKAKSSFLANMSHDIRTPINAVLGMDEMILRETVDKTIYSYAADIKTAGKTLLSLINDILDFSKIEQGKMEIIPTQYELSSVINDLVNMVRDRAEKKGLELIVEVDKETPHLLYGDEIRIKQVLLNLLTNAVKYTENGQVRLYVDFSKTSEKDIRLSYKVSDTGMGIKPEDMDRLFSPFLRIEEKRNRAIEGTGLGMSIVQQLLALMNSRLDVKSVYGEGSEFSFEIEQGVVDWEPVGELPSDSWSAGENREIYQELFHAPDANILVVDDTEINLVVMKNLLKKTQIKIDTAASGKEALVVARKQEYDIIFIDHMMPDMDGIETLHRIKEESPANKTVYISLTANAISGARQMYLDAGYTDYLSKPVDGRRLEEMLKKYLPAEKILPLDVTNVEQESNSENISEESGLPQWLLDIPELDIDQGLANCGSEDSYLSVLEVFCHTAAQKADEIETFYKDGAIEDYTIKVHALKSSARIIGATSLSELAKGLEEAGKVKDMDKIDQKTDELVRNYRGLGEKLSIINQEDSDKEDLPEDMRKDAYQTICEIAQSMDYSMMDQLMQDIKKYKLSPEDEERFNQMDEMLMQFNWEKISQIAKEVIDNEM